MNICIVVENWIISPFVGIGNGPEYANTVFFCVVPPTVRSETRVDRNGLEDILPERIYDKFLQLYKE